MGRYPLRTAMNSYMENNKRYLAETTYAERGRKLRMMATRFEELSERDPTLESDPAKWTEKEIAAILIDMRKRGLGIGTQRKNLGHINAVLKFCGNGVVSKMKAMMPHTLPRGHYIRGPSLTEGQVSDLLKATDRMDGWTGEIARFTVSIYAFTGLRLSELRRAKREDLDTKSWTLRVSHPKGEGSYGELRVLPIPTPIRSTVERFLKVRSEMLAKKGLLEVEPLIPRMNGDPNSIYSVNHFEKIARDIREVSGIEFDFRTLRRTYGQTLINKGVQLQSVSLMLGHTTTKTTETYYCRQDMNSAKLEVLGAFEECSQGRKFNPPVIDRKNGFTGYV